MTLGLRELMYKYCRKAKILESSKVGGSCMWRTKARYVLKCVLWADEVDGL